MKHGVIIAKVVWQSSSSLSTTTPHNTLIGRQIDLKYSSRIFLDYVKRQKSTHWPVNKVEQGLIFSIFLLEIRYLDSIDAIIINKNKKPLLPLQQ